MKKRHVTQSNSSIKIWFSYTCSSIHTIFSQTVASFNLQSIFPNANGNDKITPYLVNKYIKDPLKGTHCEGTSYRRVPVLREHGPSTPRHPQTPRLGGRLRAEGSILGKAWQEVGLKEGSSLQGTRTGTALPGRIPSGTQAPQQEVWYVVSLFQKAEEGCWPRECKDGVKGEAFK